MSGRSVGRREALRRLGRAGVGVAATPLWFEALAAHASEHAHALHQAAAPPAGADWAPRALTPEQNELVVVLSELILPATDTPGAAAALVNRFVDAVLDDADDDEKAAFLRGLAWMDERSQGLFGAAFAKAAPDQQAALLTIVSSKSNRTLEDRIGVEFFEAIKALTVTGYYTSDIGMRELGDDGTLFFTGYAGCAHPQHRKA